MFVFLNKAGLARLWEKIKALVAAHDCGEDF